MSLAPLSISSTARSMRFGAPAIMSSVKRHEHAFEPHAGPFKGPLTVGVLMFEPRRYFRGHDSNCCTLRSQQIVNDPATHTSLEWREPVRVMSDAHAQQRRESRRDRQVHNLPRRESRPPLSA